MLFPPSSGGRVTSAEAICPVNPTVSQREGDDAHKVLKEWHEKEEMERSNRLLLTAASLSCSYVSSQVGQVALLDMGSAICKCKLPLQRAALYERKERGCDSAHAPGGYRS